MAAAGGNAVNLEYFISSLPMLLEDSPAKISPDDFAALCREQLPPSLADAAAEMMGGATAALAHPFVREWRDRETQLRNAVAAERAKRRTAAGGGAAQARTEPRPTHGCDSAIADGVAHAFASSDPLARERALDAVRWRVLDELQGVAPFTEAVVLAYAGKLALNSRRFSIDDEKGLALFAEKTAKKD